MTRRGRWAVAGLLPIALLLLLVAGLHTPPARARVLAAIAGLLRQRGLILDANRLDYNLLARDVRLHGLRISVAGSDSPFLTAEDARVVVGWRVLKGAIDLNEIDLVRPRVTLVRHADGSTNWPASTGPPSASPPAIRLQGVHVADLSVRWRDDPDDAALALDGLTVRMTPTGDVSSGTIRLDGSGRFAWRGRETRLTTLNGHIAWNGRDLDVGSAQVAIPEGTVQATGRVRSLLGDARLELQTGANVDLARIAQWFDEAGRLSGEVRADAHITGRASSPGLALRVAARDVSAYGVRAPRINLSGTIGDGAAEITSATAELAGGSLEGAGRLSTAGGPGTLHAAWSHVDVGVLAAALLPADARFRPASVADGSIDARWKAPRSDLLGLRGIVRLRDTSASAGHPPSTTGVGGSIALEVERQRWTLHARTLLASAVGVEVDTQGTVDAAHPTRSTLSGRARVSATDLAALARTFAGATGGAPIGGRAEGEFSLAGTLGTPRLAGTLALSDLRYRSLGGGALQAGVAADTTAVHLTDVNGTLGANRVRGDVRVELPSGRLNGAIELALADLGTLPVEVDRRWRPQGRADIQASLDGSLSKPRALLRATGTLAAAGQRVDRFDAAVDVGLQRITVEHLQAERGAGRFEIRGHFEPGAGAYEVHARATDFPITPLRPNDGPATAPISAELTGTIDGRGSLDALGGSGQITLARVHWADADAGTIVVDLSGSGRELTADVRAPAVAFSGHGEMAIDPHGALRARGRWTPDDLTAMWRRLGWSPPFELSGAAAASVDVSGARDRLDELKIVATLDALEADADGHPLRLRQPARIEYDGRALRVGDLDLRLGESTLAIGGGLGGGDAAGLTATLHGSLGDFSALQRLARPENVEAIGPAEGIVDAVVQARGTLKRPDLSGTLRVTDGRVPLTKETIADVSLAARYENGVLTLEQAHAGFEGATVDATGRAPAALLLARLPSRWRAAIPQVAGPAALEARVVSITPKLAAPFTGQATLAEVDGRVDAAIHLEADRARLDRLTGSVVLDRAEIAVSGIRLDQQIPTRLEIRNGRVTIAAWQWGRGDNQIALDGGLTLGGDHRLDVTARGAIDLRLVAAFLPSARTSGRADFQMRLAGRPAAPAIDGFVTFANGEMRMSSPRLIVTDLTGTVMLSRDALTFERLYAGINGGDAEIGGRLHHRTLTDLDGTVTISSRDSALELMGLRAEANADLSLTLEPRGPLVSGTVTLVRSAYREPLSLAGGVLEALRSGPTVAGAAPSPLDRLRLDVRVVTGEDLVVDNNYAQLGAEVDLRVNGTAARPLLAGRIALDEGGAIFFGGNRYRLDKPGRIDFVNTAALEPTLSLSAVTRVNSTAITLSIDGTPSAFRTALTSDDPSLSQADLVSLLVTGHTAQEAAAAGYAPGTEALVGYLSGEVFGAAGRAIGLDVVRVERGTPDLLFDAGLAATRTDPRARLTFGKTLGSRWQVLLSQNLQQSGQFTWLVGFAPTRTIDLRVVSLDDGERLYGFQQDLSLGGRQGAVPRTRASQPVVAGVQIDGAGADEPALRSRLKLTRDDTFNFFRWQDDRDRLEAYYHDRDRAEARVTAARRVSEDGRAVTLVYDIHPGPRTRIQVDGAALPRGVVDELTSAWTRAVADEFLVEEASDIVRGALVERGYVNASAHASVVETDDSKLLRIVADAGPRASEKRLLFDGNTAFSSGELLEVLAEGGLDASAWIDPTAARDALVAFYREQGFLKASVRTGDIVLSGKTATRTFHIAEGDRFTVRRVSIEGAHAAGMGDLVEASGLAVGTPVSQEALNGAGNAIESRYRASGFNAVGVSVQALPAGDGKADVRIDVDEGPQQVIREVTTSGLSRTSPTLVAHALRLKAGAPLNLSDLAQARQRLYETGAFRSVDIEPEPLPRPPGAPAEQPIRARVTLEEWAPVRLRYGLELTDSPASSSVDSAAPAPFSATNRTFGIGVAGDVGLRNLFGQGVSTGVAGRYENGFRGARVYATLHSLFGAAVTTNFFVTRSRETLGNTSQAGASQYVTDVTNATVEQQVRRRRSTQIIYRYTFERNHTFDLNPDPFNPLPYDVQVRVASVASTLLVDTRDDFSDATRGWFHSSNVEYAASAFGSEASFFSYLLQQRYYRPVGRIVVAGAAQLGLGWQLITNRRFTAGGGNSVRGYAQDTLSPTDVLGQPAGGNALVVLNGEVRFPIFRIFRGVGFVDAGRAFEHVSDIRLGELGVGIGAGLRIETPLALFRVDFGVPLETSVGPRTGRWFFSIGQAF